MSSNKFYPLKVKNIRRETPDTVSVVFDIPGQLKDIFSYQAGQYLTLKFDLDGEEVRRAYSMSSSPAWEEDLQVTVKKVEGGRVSCYIHDELKEGDTVEVMAPQGRFTLNTDAGNKRALYLFGAGSGITPLMSIIKTVLEEEPLTRVFLLYGNRNKESIIFLEKLEALQQKYEGQLVVEHMLSRSEGSGLFSGLFKKTSNGWKGRPGRIDARAVRKFLKENAASGEEAKYLICGPGEMIPTIRKCLLDQGKAKTDILTEYFSSTELPHEKVSPQMQGEARAIVHLDGQKIEITIPEGKKVLDVLIESGYDPPYSCTSGTCSTCMAKLISGKVRMDTCLALDDEEVAEGYILTCQSHPETPEIELTYDV